MFLQPKTDSEFELEYKGFVPKEGEVRYVANKNAACAYYFVGIEQCRRRMMELAGNPQHPDHNKGFLPCKRIVDAHYRCMTDEKYGYTINEAPEQSVESVDKFFACAFKTLDPLIKCRPHFDNIVRNIYRSEDNQLDDSSI